MSKFGVLGHRLYTGEISYDFIGHRRRWYLVSAVLIAISLITLFGRGLQFGIEFEGGADFKAPTQVNSQTIEKMQTALEASGVPELQEATITTIGDNQVRVQTRPLDPTEEVPKVRASIAKEVGIGTDEVAYSLIGASWGGQITERALIALGVFLTLVGLMIWVYFRDGKMSAAALVALGHDLILTVGIYALVGFTVTPATLIGVLTILGYSLYDTVVVFDKVRENVRDIKSSTTKTYSEAANLAVNQVLVRSINTTIIGVLPVVALLIAGAVILGEGPLKDLALALFVGMVSGAYSSIFIATPLLAQLKEREPEMKKHAARVAARRAKDAQKPAAAKVPVVAAVVAQAPPAKTPAVDPIDQATVDLIDDVDEAEVEVNPPRPPRAGEVTVNFVDTGGRAGLRPLSDGAAKRPQPQHKPRSQRKK
jgi:preprotein translocase subunit SecF